MLPDEVGLMLRPLGVIKHLMVITAKFYLNGKEMNIGLTWEQKICIQSPAMDFLAALCSHLGSYPMPPEFFPSDCNGIVSDI